MTRVLLTYEQVRAYGLPATEGKHGDPRWPAFASSARCSGRWRHWSRTNSSAWFSPPSPPYIDRDVLAQQIAREEQQRGALADFLGGWGAEGRT
ncbi:hypothetical protein ACFVGY_19620 [Streptomyces sp. NPDC127106]|uniref:hypothetical protein n=1 Tax=Streptomyces sp. NPDC127106 TaxID=3345360 RepID=UPI00363AD3CB